MNIAKYFYENEGTTEYLLVDNVMKVDVSNYPGFVGFISYETAKEELTSEQFETLMDEFLVICS